MKLYEKKTYFIVGVDKKCKKKGGVKIDDTIFNMILTLIPIALSIITGFIIPWIKTKIKSEKLIIIVKWVTYAVKCAELIFDGEKQGESKKQYVIDFINKMFNSKKIVITEEQINILIECCVKELKDSSK